MPPVFQPFDVAQGSHGLLQPTPIQTDKPVLSPGDVCVGCIVWLPPKDVSRPSIRCINDNCCGNEELDHGGHNHPVVVLKIRQRKGSAVIGDLICTVACVTTFSDTPLPKYLSKRRHRERSIPIFDPEAVALTSPRGAPLDQLNLEEGRLKKQSYVRLQHTYRVPVSMLRQYAYRKCRAYKRRLSNESYDMLMGLLVLTPEKYETTKTLFETKNERLLDLARTGLPTVVRTQQAVQPARIAAQPNPYRMYGSTHVNPPTAHHIPPAYIYPARYQIQPSNDPEEDGGDGCSLLSKCVAGLALVGLAWWMFWRPPVRG